MALVTGDVPEATWDPLPSVTVQVSSGCRGGAAHLDVECPGALAQGDGQRAVRDGDESAPPTSSASVVAVEQPKVIVLPLTTASVTVNGMSIVPRLPSATSTRAMDAAGGPSWALTVTPTGMTGTR